MPRRRLRDYQEEKGMTYCKSVGHPALYWEMRLGKNIVTIRICKYWGCNFNIIVSPFETFNSWIDELHLENEDDIVILEGTRKQRLNKLNERHKWNILNSQGYIAVRQINLFVWDALIYDESYSLHDPKTKTTKYFIKYFRDVKHRFVLSGLPDPEDRLNYVPQLMFLNPDIFKDKKIKTFWDFRVKMCRPAGFKWSLTQKGKEYLQKKLAEYTSILSKKDVNLHGETVSLQKLIKQTPLFYSTQKVIVEELVMEIQGKEIKSTVYAPNGFGWLHQLCGGFANGEFIFKNKLISLKNFIKEKLMKEQFVLCAVYRNELDMLFVELNKMNISADIIFGDIEQAERRRVENNFKKEKFQVLIINPLCYKYGANISTVDTMLFYSSPASLNVRRQVEQRIIDVHQVNSGLIVEFNVENSIDVDISESIKNKENGSELWKRVIKRYVRAG